MYVCVYRQQQTTPATHQSAVDTQLCVGDDEDCSASSGVEEPAAAVQTGPTTSWTPAPASTAVIRARLELTTSTRPQPAHGPPASPTRPPPPTRRSDADDRPAPGPLSAAPPPSPVPDQATPGQRYSSLDGQQHHHQRGSNNSMAAISMNIILIVGIAAAFVVLLLILIFAFCAYSRQRPAGGAGARARPKASSAAGKLDNKGYTYEACNTSPPMPVVLNACNYQPLPAAGHAPYSTMSMTFQPMSADPIDAKPPPAKKDVKEWYV